MDGNKTSAFMMWRTGPRRQRAIRASELWPSTGWSLDDFSEKKPGEDHEGGWLSINSQIQNIA